MAWASLVSQILIVFTGGLVRLTGSGLGCPTWPECQPGSLVTVQELGVHGVIEFANRMLTFVLLIISLLTFLVVLKYPKTERKGLFWTSFALGLGIVAQAVLGGITVLTGLNSWVVGAHFLVSMTLISIATILVWYSYGAKVETISSRAKLLVWVSYVFGIVTVFIGVVVTGSGPHSGDEKAVRNGFDVVLLSHLHSYPAYLSLLLFALLLWTLFKSGISVASNYWLIVVLLLQAAIGVMQSRLGLPIEFVAVHMLLASVMCSLLTWQQLTRGLWLSRE